MRLHMRIESQAMRISGKWSEHLRHIHSLGFIPRQLRHHPILTIAAPGYTVDIPLLMPPPDLLKLSHMLQSTPMDRRGKGNILILNS
jgi:hypothetical protein